ncbi:MAG: SAM-dependent methyltransferase [Beggiatoa sp.]|nr:SAM-dependent methyltransferase [Beggiatoa sp.]
MAELKNVPGTAFIVAEYRAEENAAPDPLYRDSIVEMFLNEATRQAAAKAVVASPSVKDGVKLRTRYLDDALEEEIARGCRQVVILGSGLDTRAVRKQATGVAYFEFDDKATLDLKRARFAEHGLQAALALIPANYVTDDWIALLAENRFDFNLPTYIIWEGNTMYLMRNDMKRVMVAIREQIRYATLSFDYLSTKVIDKSTGDAGLSALVEHLARLGAPWITGIDDVYALSDELGLDVIRNVATADLHRWHWPTRPMSSSFLRFYSLCTLATRSESARLTQSRSPRAIST